MRVRALLAGAATAAVLAFGTGTAANATYPAPDDSLAVESSVVEPGESFSVTISGPNGSDATLSITTEGTDASIAGTVSLTKVITDNTAVFTVTLPEDASGTVVLTSAIDGVIVDTATVTIDEDGDTDGGDTDGAGAGAGTDGGLAATGADNMGLAVAAGGLLVAGAAALAVGARRKAGSNNVQSGDTVSV